MWILLPCRKADTRCFQQGKQDVKAERDDGHINTINFITSFVEQLSILCL